MATEIFDLESGTWSSGDPMPSPRWEGTNAQLGVDRILYVAGEGEGSLHKTIFQYDDQGSWTTLALEIKKGYKAQAGVMIRKGIISC